MYFHYLTKSDRIFFENYTQNDIGTPKSFRVTFPYFITDSRWKSCVEFRDSVKRIEVGRVLPSDLEP